MKDQSPQEETFRKYLFAQGIAYEQHKRIQGYGNKIWIVDFYLPEHSIVVELKRSTFLRHKQMGESNLAGIYKDLYKLDELIHRYDLIGVLFLELKNYKLPQKFIDNVTEHRIFCIWEAPQIMPVLQGKKLIDVNKLPLEPMKPNLAISQKEEVSIVEKTIEYFPEVEAWANGKSYREIGLNQIAINRKLREYLKISLAKKEKTHE